MPTILACFESPRMAGGRRDNFRMTVHACLCRFFRRVLLAGGLLCASSGALQAAEALPWFEGGRPGPLSMQAVSLLSDAASHGLEPRDYRPAQWLQTLLAARQGPAPHPEEVRSLEDGLSATLQRYLLDLHQGRIDPRLIHENFRLTHPTAFDPEQALRQAFATRQLEDAVRQAVPRVPLYENLRAALAHYRQQTGHPAWQQALPPLPASQRSRAGKLEPGQTYAGLALLALRLSVLGDLDPSAALGVLGDASRPYEGPLVQAVRSFQERHALGVDGVVGRDTLAQLNVAPGQRVRQIELALERLRWTPLLQGPRMIVVNIPEFVLRAYETVGTRIVVQAEMKVIVGKALDTRTPLFDEDMRFIEFSPYWNVPPSIARSETVPHLRRDPAYFDRMGFEFVAPDGWVETALTPARLDAVLAGQLRIRQRPGPANALGDIKFVFPNLDSIYLHHTPAVGLFERERRDFSHGCIRVEKPVELAKFVLHHQPEWTDERIAEAMSRGESSTLRLKEPVPVLIAYGTTLVKKGRVYFFPDVYGHDESLDHALRQRSTELQTALGRSTE